MRIIYPSIIDYYKQGEVNAALTTLSGNLVSDFTNQDTTISGDIIFYVDQQDSLLSEQIITASGDIISQIPIDYITTEELTTTSGDIVAQIGDISGSSVKISATQAGHGFSIQDVIRRSSGSYVKALANIAENAEACGIVESVDGDSFTFVENGIIEGLSGLTDGAVYFLSATSAGLMTTTEPDSNLYFSKPLMIATSSTTGLVIILRGLTVVSGTSSYATQDWVNTNFPDNTEMTTISGDIIAQIGAGEVTLEQLTTTSGDIISQIPIDYISDSEMTTISGDIVAQIGESGVTLQQLTTTSGDIIAQMPVDYVSDLEMTTISGDIVAQIGESGVTQEQLTTTSGDIIDQIPSLTGYATESWVGTNYIDNSEMTTISGDIVSQIGESGVTLQQLTTTSGDIISQIPDDYISDAEMTTISGDIVAQIGESGVTLQQLTTTSGDIVSQIPTDYITDAEMTTISGDIVAQIGAGEVTLEQLTTTSGDIIAYVDQQVSDVNINMGYYENISTGSGTFSAEGTIINHYLDTENHFVSVIPTVTGTEQAAKIGTVHATLGLNSDTIYCTGLADAEGLSFSWIATASGNQTGIECITCSGNDLYVTRNITAVSGTFTEGIKVGNDSLHITTSGIIFPDRTEITSTEGLGGGDVSLELLNTTSGDLVRQIYVGTDWEPPDFVVSGTTSLIIPKGIYHKGGYKYKGRYQEEQNLPEYWDIPTKFCVNIVGTYASGVSSGFIDGAVPPAGTSNYTAYLMDDLTIKLLPFVFTHTVSVSDGNTRLIPALHSTTRGTSGSWTLDLSNSTALAGYTVRVLLPNADIIVSGDKVRVQIHSHLTTGNSFDNVSIVERSSGANGTAIPTELTFNGSSGVTIAANTIAVSDWTNFVVDQTKDYLLILDVSATAQNQRASQNGWTGKATYYKSASDSWNTKDMPASYSTASEHWFVYGIEVMSSGIGYFKDNTFNDYKLLKIAEETSPYEGNIYTVSSTVSGGIGASNYLEIVSDKTAEITVGTWYKMLPPEGEKYMELGYVRMSVGSVSPIRKTGKKYTILGSYGMTTGAPYNTTQIYLSDFCSPEAQTVFLGVRNFQSTAVCGIFIDLRTSAGATIRTTGYHDNISNTKYSMDASIDYPITTPGIVYFRGYKVDGSWVAASQYTGAQGAFYVLGWEV